MRDGLEAIGFASDEIREIEDRGNEDLENELTHEVYPDIKASSAQTGAPLLLFVVYIGHAMARGRQVHCLDQNGSESFNLEAFILKCARLPNCRAISIFACCRRDQGGVAPLDSSPTS